ncbi:MAG TPA: hypothetical protein EYN66_15370, partial [Myxococcales bacterium]|nr:hypothetical protein [Myxococcales bacterium]
MLRADLRLWRENIMRFITALLAVLLLGCPTQKDAATKAPAAASTDAPVAPSAGKANSDKSATPSMDEAKAFMDATEKELLQLWINLERTAWVKSTHITHDTEIVSAAAEVAVMKFISEKARASRRFESLKMNDTLTRKFALLKRALTLPAPSDSKKRTELARTKTQMESMYGKGTYCLKGTQAKDGKCPNLGDLSDMLATKRDYDLLLDIWTGWRKVGASMADKYRR